MADVCIVGGGLTGLSTALILAENGVSVILLESHRLGHGASGRNGGQLINGFSCDLQVLEKSVGKENAKQLWELTNTTIEEIDDRIASYKIKCNRNKGYVFAATNERQMRYLRDLKIKLNEEYGYKQITLLEKPDIQNWINSDLYYGGLLDANCGQMHPLNYLQGLALKAKELGVRIFENSKAISIIHRKAQIVRTSNGLVHATSVLLAGNAYLTPSASLIGNTITPITSSVAVTSPLSTDCIKAILPTPVAVADCNNILDYYRITEDNRLLFGAGANFLGQEVDGIENFIRNRITRVFPQIKEFELHYAWNGFIASTINKLPHIGVINSNIYFAQGFSGHGLAATGLVAKLISEAMMGTPERFNLLAKVKHRTFPPKRLKDITLQLSKVFRQIEDLIR